MKLLRALSFVFVTYSTAWALEMQPQVGAVGYGVPVLSTDGRYIAFLGTDHSVRLWEVESGKVVRILKGLSSRGESMHFSRDGERIVASDGNRRAVVWRRRTGDVVTSTTLPLSAQSAVFTADGNAVWFALGNDSLVRWDLSTGALRTVNGTGKASLGCQVALSPDGKLLAHWSNDGRVRLHDAASGDQQWASTQTVETARALSFSGSGKYLAVGSDTGRVQVWEVATRASVVEFQSEPYVSNIFWSPQDRSLMVQTIKRLQEFDLRKGQQLRRIATKSSFSSATPDGRLFANWDEEGGRINVHDLASGHLLRRLESAVRQAATGVAFSPDGTVLAVSTYDGATLWDLSLGKPRRFDASREPFINGVTVFSRDGAWLVSGSGQEEVVLRGTASGEVVRLLKHPFFICAAFSPDGRLLVTGGSDGNANVWEVETGRLVRSLQAHGGMDVRAIAFAPDGQQFATTGFDATVRIWGTATGAELRRGKLPNIGHGLAWNGKGTLLAAANGQGSVVFYSAERGAFEQPLAVVGSNRQLSSLAFSPDGKLLAVASTDPGVVLLDVATRREVRRFSDHQAPVNSIAFSPDGRFMASASDDGVVRLRRTDSWTSVGLLSDSNGEWLLYGDDGLFDSSFLGGRFAAMVQGDRGFAIDQLALRNNRPDLLLERMGMGTPTMRDYYKQRYRQRLTRAGQSEAELAQDLEGLPSVTLRSTSVRTGGAEAEVSFHLEDRIALRSYQIYVNGVPVHKGLGKDARGRKADLAERIPLVKGENTIEVSALNTRGQESLRALASVTSEREAPRALYFLGLGVSDYQDPVIQDLSWAHKDVADLATAFGKIDGYASIHVKTLTNKEVTAAAVRSAGVFLKDAAPQDTVVLFIAGHGLHDEDPLATYYYVTHDTVLAELAHTAVSFEDVEALLAAVRARQKVVFVDTCESGERDTALDAATLADASNALHARATRGIGRKKESTTSDPTPRAWLLERDRFIYQDLVRRTGAVVFASSRGSEFSYESSELQNGLFTSALLEGLFQSAADENRDGVVAREELRRYLSQKVASLSKGLQHPTVDRDNPLMNLEFRPGTALKREREGASTGPTFR
jgi:WD40 repeat protein